MKGDGTVKLIQVLTTLFAASDFDGGSFPVERTQRRELVRLDLRLLTALAACVVL